MLFFGNRVPKEQLEDKSLLARVNQLEIAMQTLQLESAERALAVLNACEKVLHQLGARERKRQEENPSQDDPQSTISPVPFRGDGPARRRNY